ncbi:lasso peptide [Vacuolonema iberomarrocanum]|uniref:lasso peptide n=1 Tax=Vacuolonema iberomarrocanum TaxID=3454632 RepID=UPI001A093A97|nr:lasso peptide [filamentous cyanobacterium LEGE 07170]
MKKAYVSPQMTVHGSVEQLTQVVGSNSPQDVLIFNGQSVSDNTLSQDINIDIG